MATEVTLSAAVDRSLYFVAPRPGWYEFIWVVVDDTGYVYSIQRNNPSSKIGNGQSWTGVLTAIPPVAVGDNVAGVAAATVLVTPDNSGTWAGTASAVQARRVMVELDESDEFHMGPAASDAGSAAWIAAVGTDVEVHYWGRNPGSDALGVILS